MAERILILIYLGINSVNDIRKKEILLWSVYLYMFIWGFMMIRSEECGEQLLIAGICLAVTGSFSIMSGGHLGFGDVLILSSLGLLLHVWELLYVAGAGLLLAFGYSTLLIILRKAGRRTEIPFVPFLFLGYIGGLCIW